MSGFWDNKLGNPRPAPPAAPVQQTPAGQQLPWWAYPSTPHTPQPLASQDEQSHAQVAASKAASARQNLRCPDCHSGNYFTVAGLGGGARCFDCGYPVRHSTSGASLPSHLTSEQPTRAARQLPTEGFQPTKVVDRIA
ncbi:hypothetical protein [Actinomadura atramentaria]|uniref:hypothetical protein n=1 Tax=Actinomadura atramentaria TaxID=1990 RepID=UPI00037D7B2F|nr:hypothetical protein [Actinomadura atramentaria]